MTNRIIVAIYIFNTILHKSAKPFVFGIIDNAIMVLVGDQLDATLQATLHLCTMYAAGVGNAVSDLIGEASSSYMDKVFKDVEIPKNMENSTLMKILIKAIPPIAIFLGCIVGMFALPIKRWVIG